MIKIETIEVSGLEGAIFGMRNPFKTREKSDSGWKHRAETDDAVFDYVIGERDLVLCQKLLASAKDDDSKFMRMIHVQADITAPLYWWKEFDTYKIGTVANSESTMHTIAQKAFTRNDFSCEMLIDEYTLGSDKQSLWSEDSNYPMCPSDILDELIDALNALRKNYLDAMNLDKKEDAREYWYNMIQLLPTSYMQKRTVDLNYQTIRRIFFARRGHKLAEWSGEDGFCAWVKSLPYAKELITYDSRAIKRKQGDVLKDMWVRKIREILSKPDVFVEDRDAIMSFLLYISDSSHCYKRCIEEKAEELNMYDLMTTYCDSGWYPLKNSKAEERAKDILEGEEQREAIKKRVLELKAQGHSDKEISNWLGISEGTVRNYAGD